MFGLRPLGALYLVSWRVRLAVALLMVYCGCQDFDHQTSLLTDRFTESNAHRAELRIALYSGKPAGP